ncbi:MAG: phosphatidylserine decarboxylase family protein [Longimicrobiales bacterium]
MRIPIAKEGAPFIAIALVLFLVALWWARPQQSDLRVIPPAALGLLLVFVVYFFRDPERRLPSDALQVVAPADGKIIEVKQVTDEPFMDGPATRITIFLSIFNVHVQRAPVSGTVGLYAYHPGGYLVAWHEKASAENERASLGIQSVRGPVVVRQIAGLIARRIVTYPRENDTLDRGDRIGLIRFGSRVDLFLPASWPVSAAVGDKVKGGQTVLAQLGGAP